MKTKFFGILPLLLCTHALMAAAPKEVKSSNEYTDFTVTIKALEEGNIPGLFEFTIFNYGNDYLSKKGISQNRIEEQKIVPIENIDSVQDNFSTLIKPKETCILQSYVDPKVWKIEDGEFNDFYGTSYEIRNDVVNVSGPYDIEITEEDDYRVLEIKCAIDELLELDTPKIDYSYFYAISITYDGEEFCVVSEPQSDLNKIITRFTPNQEMDPSKLKINKKDSFIYANYVMNCTDPFGIMIFKLMLILLAGLVISGIIFGTVAVHHGDKKVLKQ